jgi:hypothetical protein
VIWMLRNSRGRPDALLTFSAGAVAVVLLKVLASGVVVGGVALGSIDATLAGAVLTPLVAAYTAKRVAGGKADAGEPKP